MGVTYYPGNPELTFWCPNVNIFRDPRWGRGQETCGEDPYLNAVLGVQTVLGMQGNDDRYFKTHACAKHYAVHSGPEPLRHTYNASVSMRDLWETYLPAFEKLVKEAEVEAVMGAYNRVGNLSPRLQGIGPERQRARSDVCLQPLRRKALLHKRPIARRHPSPQVGI